MRKYWYDLDRSEGYFSFLKNVIGFENIKYEGISEDYLYNKSCSDFRINYSTIDGDLVITVKDEKTYEALYCVRFHYIEKYPYVGYFRWHFAQFMSYLFADPEDGGYSVKYEDGALKRLAEVIGDK